MDSHTLPPFIPRKPIRYRPRTARAPQAGPPVALTLVAATYSTGAWVRLTFDRNVNIAGIHVANITVNDDPSDEAYVGSGAATLFSANTVQVPLVVAHSSSGPGIALTATNATGIVAVDDGGTWAGVTNVALPFP